MSISFNLKTNLQLWLLNFEEINNCFSVPSFHRFCLIITIFYFEMLFFCTCFYRRNLFGFFKCQSLANQFSDLPVFSNRPHLDSYFSFFSLHFIRSLSLHLQSLYTFFFCQLYVCVCVLKRPKRPPARQGGRTVIFHSHLGAYLYAFVEACLHRRSTSTQDYSSSGSQFWARVND